MSRDPPPRQSSTRLVAAEILRSPLLPNPVGRQWCRRWSYSLHAATIRSSIDQPAKRADGEITLRVISMGMPLGHRGYRLQRNSSLEMLRHNLLSCGRTRCEAVAPARHQGSCHRPLTCRSLFGTGIVRMLRRCYTAAFARAAAIRVHSRLRLESKHGRPDSGPASRMLGLTAKDKCSARRGVHLRNWDRHRPPKAKGRDV